MKPAPSFRSQFLAAVLAVLGYSVNESVVVFDRVRETFKKVWATYPRVLDHAITSTISHCIITHGSTQVMVPRSLLFGDATFVLLRTGTDHRHLLRHLLVGSGRQPAGSCGSAFRASISSSTKKLKRQRGRCRRPSPQTIRDIWAPKRCPLFFPARKTATSMKKGGSKSPFYWLTASSNGEVLLRKRPTGYSGKVSIASDADSGKSM